MVGSFLVDSWIFDSDYTPVEQNGNNSSILCSFQASGPPPSYLDWGYDESDDPSEMVITGSKFGTIVNHNHILDIVGTNESCNISITMESNDCAYKWNCMERRGDYLFFVGFLILNKNNSSPQLTSNQFKSRKRKGSTHLCSGGAHSTLNDIYSGSNGMCVGFSGRSKLGHTKRYYVASYSKTNDGADIPRYAFRKATNTKEYNSSNVALKTGDTIRMVVCREGTDLVVSLHKNDSKQHIGNNVNSVGTNDIYNIKNGKFILNVDKYYFYFALTSVLCHTKWHKYTCPQQSGFKFKLSLSRPVWRKRRLLWLAYLKNTTNSLCLIGKLPKDVIKYMQTFI